MLPQHIKHFFSARILLILALLVSVSCGKKDESGRDSGAQGQRGSGTMGGRDSMAGAGGVPVQVEAVTRADISTFLLNTTTLQAEREVEVLAKVSGQVGKLLAEEGDVVRAGQALAQLDEQELILQLRESEIRAQTAKSNFERTKNMFEKNLVSKENLEDMRYQYESAQAAYETAKLKVDYTDIRSPIAGVVTGRLIELGQRVNLNQAVFRVADFDPLRAVIHVPERDMRQVRVGQQARITAEALTGNEFSGKVRMISPIVDPASGTMKVTIDINDRTGLLKPGMFVTTFIITETHADALVIPKKALILESDADQVYVYDNGVARKVTLQLGFQESDRVEVLSGLNEGEQVVTVGQEGLREGLPIRISGTTQVSTSMTPADTSAYKMAAGQQPAKSSATEKKLAASSPSLQATVPANSAGASPQVTDGQAGQSRPEGQMRQGGPGRWGQGPLDPERIKNAVERLSQRSPEFKEAWEKKMKDDDFKNDLEKQSQFLREWFQKMGGMMRGGPPQQ
ncbi:efflux RND transporter periplasmic adaptor subunit [candidate division KSB1 bacterium]|nr:efflux RND transporter periplasmic adaptor subunit [candidate division KSB1 bacterium]